MVQNHKPVSSYIVKPGLDLIHAFLCSHVEYMHIVLNK